MNPIFKALLKFYTTKHLSKNHIKLVIRTRLQNNVQHSHDVRRSEFFNKDVRLLQVLSNESKTDLLTFLSLLL